MNPFLKLLVLASILITGCSKLEVAYDFAPGIIAGRMDDYFDLESKQKSRLKKTIQSELDRIIINELPAYLELEKEWMTLLEKKDIQKTELKAHNEKTRKWLFDVFARMEPALLPFALELTPKQIEYFHKKVVKELEEHDEKTSTLKGQKKELRRRFEFGLSWNFDDLTSSEEKLFEAWLETAGYPFRDESLSRKKSTDLFLEASKSPATFKAHLETIFRNPLAFRSKEYASKIDVVLDSYLDLQLKILLGSQDKDRKRRVKHTQDVFDQLVKLREKVMKSNSKSAS